MSEIQVNATRLPGVGWRYELALARGTALFVVVEDSGRRHLLLVREGDDEPMVSVPLNEALGYILRMYDMGYAIMGRTIIVGAPDSIAKTTGKQSTRAFKIAYADLKAVGGLVQGLAGVTNIILDERLRTLYVTSSPERFPYVERVLQEVDHPGRQVMLQARIIEVTDAGRDQLETIIDAVYNQWWLNYSSGGFNLGYVYADQPDNPD